MSKHFFVTLFFSTHFIISGFSISKDSTKAFPFQAGVQASKFLSLIEAADYTQDFIFNYWFTKKYAIRSGFSYFDETRDNRKLEYNIAIGIQRMFKSRNQWKFYYGIDLVYEKDSFRELDRRTNSYGLRVLFGASVYFGKHFSLSTEPSFFIRKNVFIDKNTFDTDNQRNVWYEFKLGNTGQLQLNFHF